MPRYRTIEDPEEARQLARDYPPWPHVGYVACGPDRANPEIVPSIGVDFAFPPESDYVLQISIEQSPGQAPRLLVQLELTGRETLRFSLGPEAVLWVAGVLKCGYFGLDYLQGPDLVSIGIERSREQLVNFLAVASGRLTLAEVAVGYEGMPGPEVQHE